MCGEDMRSVHRTAVILCVQFLLVASHAEGGVRVVFPELELKPSPAERLEAWIEEPGVDKPYGVRFVCIERVK